MSSLAVAAAGGLFPATMLPTRHQQGAAFSAAHHGQLKDAQKAARREDHEVSSVGLPGPTIDDPQPGAGQKLYDLFYIALADFGADKTQPSLRLIIGGRWTSRSSGRACAAGGEGRAFGRHHADLKAGKRPSGMAEDEALVYDFVTEWHDHEKGRR